MPLTFRPPLSRRWLWSAAISLVICAAWFGYGMRTDRCWMYSRYQLLNTFLTVWVWLLLLFGLRLKGRLLLLGLSVTLAMFWPHVDSMPLAAAQAGAVGRLRQLHEAVESYKSKQHYYPDKLPQVSSTWPAEKHYRFELVPSRSADGSIVDYLIEAVPRYYPCAAMRSFSVASDGRIFYTPEPRPATEKDEVLQ
jgi:hypothetical protein